jgi:hypothetical protein
LLGGALVEVLEKPESWNITNSKTLHILFNILEQYKEVLAHQTVSRNISFAYKLLVALVIVLNVSIKEISVLVLKCNLLTRRP